MWTDTGVTRWRLISHCLFQRWRRALDNVLNQSPQSQWTFIPGKLSTFIKTVKKCFVFICKTQSCEIQANSLCGTVMNCSASVTILTPGHWVPVYSQPWATIVVPTTSGNTPRSKTTSAENPNGNKRQVRKSPLWIDLRGNSPQSPSTRTDALLCFFPCDKSLKVWLKMKLFF